MKKICFAVLTIVVLTLGTCFAASRFVDVNGTKYESAVTALTNLGVIDGFGDGTFRPQEGVTRAQLCKMLVEGLGLKQANNYALTQFKDVNSSLWSYNYIKIAVDNGIIKGYTDGTFQPNNNVKFSELFTMIIRAMGRERYVSNTANWPNAYIQYAQNNGLMTNVYYASVSDPANRGEVAVAVNNMVNQLGYNESTKTGFVTSYAKNNGIYYAVIDGTTYTVASGSKDFEEDTFVVFERSGIGGNITLVKSYGVTDLDANAEIITAVSGTKAGDQEVKFDGNSKYTDYFTKSNISKYEDYAICVMTVKPNSKDVLTVSKHYTYDSLSDVKFATGDRVIEDSKNEVFVVFKGLDADDVVKKGKYTAAEDDEDYAKISYKWETGSSISGITLPSSERVAIGTKYRVQYPTSGKYGFYSSEGDSFTVKRDTVIYLTSYLLDDDDEGGYAGSNIPLKDNLEKAEEEIISAMMKQLSKDSNIYDARVYVEKIYDYDDEQANSSLKKLNLSADEVAFEVRYELKLKPNVEPYQYTAGSGYYDSDTDWVVDIYRVGILRPSGSSYKITDLGTGF